MSEKEERVWTAMRRLRVTCEVLKSEKYELLVSHKTLIRIKICINTFLSFSFIFFQNWFSLCVANSCVKRIYRFAFEWNRKRKRMPLNCGRRVQPLLDTTHDQGESAGKGDQNCWPLRVCVFDSYSLEPQTHKYAISICEYRILATLIALA